MDTANEITAISALADPVRRRLYEFVSSQNDAVSRESAASEIGVSLPKAKFHLERLVAEGLLESEYRRLSGKSGPGAGRPAKLYRRSRTEFQVSVPERHYDLAGNILATAIESAETGTPLREAVDSAAHAAGLAAGSRHRDDPADHAEGTAGREDEQVISALESMGYEPEVDGDTVRLRNCPFDSLVKDHTELICSANHSYVQGVVEGMRCECTRAALDPSEGYCCVTLSRDAER